MADAFADLMARLGRGDEAAATEIFQRFAHRLIGLAKSRLHQFSPQKVDPEDVMQSVLKSFFLRHKEEQFEVRDWDGLWGLLTFVTLRKCGHRIEYLRAACRDVRREITRQPAGDELSPGWEAIAREPTPSEAAMLAETVEQLMNKLGPRDRDILALSLQGHTTPEISAQVGCTERTVQRILAGIKKWLEERRDGQDLHS